MKANLLFLVFIGAVCFHYSNEEEKEHRGGRIKRKVLFLPKAVWFMRLNGRINMLNYTNIFAHGWGFKITYDLPTTMSKKKLFFKRDANFDIENYLSWIDKGEFYHIMDQICKSLLRKSPRMCGVSCKIQDIIKRSNGTDSTLFQSLIKKCTHYNIKYLETNSINH